MDEMGFGCCDFGGYDLCFQYCYELFNLGETEEVNEFCYYFNDVVSTCSSQP